MNMVDLQKYPCEIIPLAEEDGGGYLARFPDVPDIFSDGETPQEALENGLDALKCALEAFAEWGKPIPKPGRASGKMALRLPKYLHAKLKYRADAEGVSTNTAAVAFIAEGLGHREATVVKGASSSRVKTRRIARGSVTGRFVTRGGERVRSKKSKTSAKKGKTR